MSNSVLHNFAWNELTNLPSSMHSPLATLVAFAPDRTPVLIGTAFIIGAYGNRALAFTAAHNLHEGVKRAQKPNPHHHLSALKEFLPGFDEIAVDQKRLRAICNAHGRVEVCVVHSVLWNSASDIAIMFLVAQNLSDQTVFRAQLQLEQYTPNVGDEVCMLGYADLKVGMTMKDGQNEMFTVESRPLLRVGRVKAVHTDGHILCRGPCIETSMPVFSGMSGGPVFPLPKQAGQALEPFAIISHDPEEEIARKNDRSFEGSSIAALLPIAAIRKTSGGREALVELFDVVSIRNADVPGGDKSAG